ncbi:hypothetical protein CTI12_AA097510 [Artemisia annua]|uniref:Uncharacterized protein n=1 Tax=Artemisia annua TaxID=35608 RepID=A0A2U1PYC9_ARTAN|nr:hypothetical protein CTI12_AA097510 [Artemisia annua]
MNDIGVDDNLQLIDFSEEDDYLIAFPFRDNLEDLRLSVSFDNVNEYDRNKQCGGANLPAQSESLEPRRLSFLRKSLAWDSAFFTSAGVLDPEELFMINKGFRKAEPKKPSHGTRKDTRLDLVSSQAQISVNSKRSKFATNIGGPACGQSNALSSKKTNVCSQNKMKSVRALHSQSINLQGPKFVTKTRITNNQIKQDKVSSLPKLISSTQTTNNPAFEGSDSAKIENKTRKAGTVTDMTVSKRSRRGDLSGLYKSTSFMTPITEKRSKFHPAYESLSSASSSKNFTKSIGSKNNPRKLKPTNSPSSVHYPLSSTCSSSTSPASSIDGWFLESLSSTNTITDQNTILTSDFQSLSLESCRNSVEGKFTSQKATRSSIRTSPFSGGPKRKIKSSGLRMPSPKIGFFDEEPILRGILQDRFGDHSPLLYENSTKIQSSPHSPSVSIENCLKARKFKEHDGKKFSASCSKLKPEREAPKEISKNRMNVEQKRQKYDSGVLHVIDTKKKQDESDQYDSQKENVYSYKDEINGLSKQLEVIDLDRDVAEVKGQRTGVKQHGQVIPIPNVQHTPLCSRTPLAEKIIST